MPAFPMPHTDFLLASLIWGCVGTGCIVYGKKQAAAPPLVAGLVLVAASYFVPSPLLLSGLGLLCLSGMVWATRRGF